MLQIPVQGRVTAARRAGTNGRRQKFRSVSVSRVSSFSLRSRFYSTYRLVLDHNHELSRLFCALCARVLDRVLFLQRLVSESAGLHPRPGPLQQTQHPDLPRQRLLPPGARAKAAPRRPTHRSQANRPGLRGELVLPPDQARPVHTPEGTPVQLQRHPQGGDQDVPLGTRHVTSTGFRYPSELWM